MAHHGHSCHKQSLFHTPAFSLRALFMKAKRSRVDHCKFQFGKWAHQNYQVPVPSNFCSLIRSCMVLFPTCTKSSARNYHHLVADFQRILKICIRVQNQTFSQLSGTYFQFQFLLLVCFNSTAERKLN